MGFSESEGKKVKKRRAALRLIMTVSSIKYYDNDLT